MLEIVFDTPVVGRFHDRSVPSTAVRALLDHPLQGSPSLPTRCPNRTNPPPLEPTRPHTSCESIGRFDPRKASGKSSPGRITRDLAVHFKRVLYLVEPGPETLPLGGKRVRVHQWADGQVEIDCDGRKLPYSIFDKNPTVDQFCSPRMPQEDHTPDPVSIHWAWLFMRLLTYGVHCAQD